jgi:hypothetical protein
MAAKGNLAPDHALRSNTDLVDYLSEILKSKEGEVETQSN